MGNIEFVPSMKYKKIFIYAAVVLSTVGLYSNNVQAQSPFHCSTIADGGNTALASWGSPCGIPGDGSDHLEIKCDTNDIAHTSVLLRCTTNQFNTCSSNVCLVSVGDTCSYDYNCEGGAVCRSNICVLDIGGDEFAGVVGTTTTDIRDAVRRFINVALGFLGVLVVLMIIYGGVLWLTAMGSDDKIQKGKHILLWAAIGAIIISIAWTISSYILSVGQQLG